MKIKISTAVLFGFSALFFSAACIAEMNIPMASQANIAQGAMNSAQILNENKEATAQQQSGQAEQEIAEEDQILKDELIKKKLQAEKQKEQLRQLQIEMMKTQLRNK